MAVRFYRRIKLTKRWGLNISKTGIRLSYRGKRFSISPRGISIKTGIKGLSFRFSFGVIWIAIAVVVALVINYTTGFEPVLKSLYEWLGV